MPTKPRAASVSVLPMSLTSIPRKSSPWITPCLAVDLAQREKVFAVEQPFDPQVAEPAKLAFRLDHEQRRFEVPLPPFARSERHREALPGQELAADLRDEGIPLRVSAKIGEHPPHLSGRRVDLDFGTELHRRRRVSYRSAPARPLYTVAGSVRWIALRLGVHSLAMLLCRARLVGLLPFDDVTLPFCDDEGRPASVHGDSRRRRRRENHGARRDRLPRGPVSRWCRRVARLRARGSASDDPAPAPHAICDWATGQDDPSRPHTLCITTPTVRLWNDEEEEAFRRREQALYDKRARERGYVFVALPSTRWFSRQPIGINAPAQTLARYDVRAPIAFDDASRSDLARETKQTLAYAEITGALSSSTATRHVDDARPARRTSRVLRCARQ